MFIYSIVMHIVVAHVEHFKLWEFTCLIFVIYFFYDIINNLLNKSTAIPLLKVRYIPSTLFSVCLLFSHKFLFLLNKTYMPLLELLLGWRGFYADIWKQRIECRWVSYYFTYSIYFATVLHLITDTENNKHSSNIYFSILNLQCNTLTETIDINQVNIGKNGWKFDGCGLQINNGIQLYFC